LKQKFLWISNAKINQEMFLDPQIINTMTMRLKTFLIEGEGIAWQILIVVTTSSQANFEAKTFTSHHPTNLSNQCLQSCGMQKSLKIHSLQSHLDSLPTDLSVVIDERGNRLYQEIFTTECYQGKWNTNKLVDY